MSEFSDGETRGLSRNLNWIRKHGTQAQKNSLKGSGHAGRPHFTTEQLIRKRRDIQNNPIKYD